MPLDILQIYQIHVQHFFVGNYYNDWGSKPPTNCNTRGSIVLAYRMTNMGDKIDEEIGRLDEPLEIYAEEIILTDMFG